MINEHKPHRDCRMTAAALKPRRCTIQQTQRRLPLSTVGDKCAKDNLGGGIYYISVHKNPYNNCCQMSFSLSEYTNIDVGWRFAPDPTGGAYSTPPDPSWFQGSASRQEGNGGEGREGLGGGEEGKGGGMEKGGERGKWGDSALVVGEIDAPEQT